MLAELPVKANQRVRIQRWAATIVMRFQQAERYQFQNVQLSSAEKDLSRLHTQLSKLKHRIEELPEETRWILDSTLRNLDAEENDDYAPAPIDDNGLEQLTRLFQCTAEIAALQEVTAAWAADAAKRKQQTRPIGIVAEAVVDSALHAFERLTGTKATVAKNKETSKEPTAFVQFVAQILKIFEIDASAESQADAARLRRKRWPEQKRGKSPSRLPN